MKILLVDDSKSARYALRLELQRYGIAVETEDAAEAALEHVRKTPPDAVFMDHTMPGMNGFEALDILKATPATRHIPVVMCTSNEDPEFIAQAKQKGALGILAKSTASEKLGGLLDRLQLATTTPAQVAEAALARRAASEKPQATADSVSEKGLDERIRTLIEPLMDELAQRLTADLSATIDRKLISRLGKEAEQLQKRFTEAQTEQAQLATNRLLSELLPGAVQQQLEDERQNIAHMVQGLIDTSLDSLGKESGSIRRVLDTVETTATRNVEQYLRRQAEEIAETVASERVEAIADRLLQSSRPASGTMYLLAAGAALVGMISATVVFLLVS
jgi:CheY-like chemotaxis protein